MMLIYEKQFRDNVTILPVWFTTDSIDPKVAVIPQAQITQYYSMAKKSFLYISLYVYIFI